MLNLTAFGPNQTQVRIGDKTWYFSYDTCVAFESFDRSAPATQRFTRVRRNRNYSKTTAKHMTAMGVKEWSQVDDATFEHLAVAS